MTQEEKQLLLEDLCERLPYGVIVQYKQKTFNPDGEYIINVKIEIDDMLRHRLQCLDFKPYLRPMSSMTEEEDKEFQEIKLSYHFDEDSYILLDWLNKKMFDYRGLIPMGLALEAPENMYTKIE